MKPLGYKFTNIFSDGRRTFTKSLTGRSTFPDEITVRDGKDLYRQWDPTRSKLSAALAKGISQIGLRENMTVLYLGAAHGYTPSFISDIIRGGMIFAVEFAPQVTRDLLFVAHERKNIAPILANASDTKALRERITDVDFVYQDIAQRNQTQIFINSCKAFLKKGGFGMLAVKARSIDVAKKPKVLFKQVRAELEKELVVVDYRELNPFEKDHCLYVCKVK